MKKLVLVLSILLVPALLIWVIYFGWSITVTESVDPEKNYAWKFSYMPDPKPEIVNSRVEREDPVYYLGFRLSPRNREWEFEMIATPSWVEELKDSFAPLPIEWADVTYRDDIPDWFSPTEKEYDAWYFRGTSGVHSIHLFVERAPEDPDNVRVFIRRH